MTYEKIFADVKKSLTKADTSGLERDLAVQCNIQGEGEGAFYIAFKDGALSVEPYDYKDNDAMLFASGDTFMKMFSKKIDGKEAFEKGLLSFEGDVGAVLELGKLRAKDAKKAAPKPKKTAAKKSAKSGKKDAKKDNAK